MTFQDFQALLDKVSDKPPTQAIARDIFELIDIKGDGLLDFNEWAHSFKLERVIAKEKFFFGEQMPDPRNPKLHGYPAPH